MVVTATANPLAFDARQKFAPPDLLDLDQSFPGGPSGFTTEQIAHAYFAEVKAAASVVINMHTMSPPFEAKAYAVYKVHPNGKVKENDLLRMIAPFKPTVACRMSVEPAQGELPGQYRGRAGLSARGDQHPGLHDRARRGRPRRCPKTSARASRASPASPAN